VRIAAFSVRNPQFTLIAFVCLAVLGVTAFLTIPRSEDPYFPTPNFGIIAVYPGASPDQIEREVVDELEKKIAELSEIKRSTARVVSNVAYIEVEFEAGVDSSDKENGLRRQVDAAREKLPSGVRSIDVVHFETTNIAVLQFALLPGGASWAAVGTELDHVVRTLKGLQGVKDVVDSGYPEQQARVDLEIGRLARVNIPPSQVIGTLQGGNASIPGGEIDVGARRFNVQTSGAFESLQELAGTVVGSRDGALVRLADVAEIRMADEPETYRVRHQGHRAALLAVMMRNGNNIFEVRERVLAAVAEIQKNLPSGMQLELAFDQSTNVAHRLGGLQRDFMIAIALVLITLIPLGLRASLLVMISIPMSLAIGVATLNWLGYSLNQLSIVGFVIALGLLVDDSIVVAENIARWMRTGKSASEAAIAATSQIGVAVLGCTATLVFAFVPLLFLPGNAGTFIRSLPVAVVVTILASLLVSFTLIPFLASRFLRGEAEHGNLAFRAMSRLIEGAYRPVLDLVMRWPKLTFMASVLLVAGSFALVPRIGFSLFPKAGIPQFVIEIETPDGSSLDTTDAITRDVESILRQEAEVVTVTASVGQGHPSMYYNFNPRSQSPTVADLLVQVREYDGVATPALIERLRERLAKIPGAEINLHEFENGPQIEAPIAIRLTGPDLARLRTLAAEVATWVSQVPGTRNVRNPLAVSRTDLEVVLDEPKAALIGVTALDVDRSVRMAISGLEIGELKTANGRNVDIVVGMPWHGSGDQASDRPDLGNLAKLEVAGPGGAVPLSQLADLEMRPAPRLITHYNRERSVTVTADVAIGANAQAVSAATLAMMGKRSLPSQYRWSAGGLFESQNESFSGLGPAVIIAMFGVLAILVLEFRSFRATLIVAAVIPLGAMGGLLALFLAGETLSFTASIGFIALIGIEVKNSLLLVDFTNQLRAEGIPLETAIRRAGEIRFFPILLTSMTAIGGLLPLVLEHSALYSPLALVIIGGLISSTLLSRLVTPVLSLLLLRDKGRLGTLGVPLSSKPAVPGIGAVVPPPGVDLRASGEAGQLRRVPRATSEASPRATGEASPRATGEAGPPRSDPRAGGDPGPVS
jgi:multidrug efflux pump subunit AcrB